MTSPSAPGPGLYGLARVSAMTAVALGLLLAVLDYSVANVALPTIGHDLHVAPSDSIWVVNAYQFASLVALLPFAALGSRVGFARMCRIGTAIFIVASILCALSHTLVEISLARVLQGLGSACILSVNLALVRFIYPPAELGKGIGLNGLVIGVGVALGPSIGAAVLSVTSWPWIFWLNVPLGGAALALASFTLPQTPRSSAPYDAPHALLSVLALGGIALGLDEFAHGHLGLTGFGPLLLGALAIGILWSRQHDRPDPIFPADLLKHGPFRTAFLVGVMGFLTSNLFMISIPFTLEAVFAKSASLTGLLITAWPIGVTIASPVSGRLADRLPVGLVSSLGLLLTGVGFFALCCLPPTAPNLVIAATILIAGTGFGIFQPPNNRAMMASARTGREGGASGMVSLSRLSGQTLGATSVACLFMYLPTRASMLCLALASSCALITATVSGSRLLNRRPKRPLL
ncbi:transporter [Acetobacter nitrogenifigens DSM 23921 = NBRC 105050]|uniref:MFS transporter n=1 Tax=Acetobacter nitrogenifigens DSM 23921 = NBRC 105050 TaxID=1120919 RepID=A0A511XC44_9PROT|nr:MFS transporter [Acetobacter nitrogenifigens]GBQ88859.1 transporter [Acetobacter nitrogenifigens DSM 23921 = NBRC 105050]GEN60510.1 MFS transporter [Acetobacter nitrogenifigens DSM 23921 = NBRC 105050]